MENMALKLEINNLKHVSELESDKAEEDELDAATEETSAAAVDNQKDDVKKMKKRQAQKEKKELNEVYFPKVGQEITYQEKGSKEWVQARVVRTFKKTSKHKNFRHLKLENGEIAEVDFLNKVENWSEVPEEPIQSENQNETYFLSEILEKNDFTEHEVFPVKVLTKSEYGRPEVTEAMQAKVEKYKTFEAFEEVIDMRANTVFQFAG